jgi:hypothetical protein
MGKLAHKSDQLSRECDGAEYSDCTLVIGNLARWSAQGRATSAFGKFHYTEFADLSRDTLCKLCPFIILSPLLDEKFDVIEIAARLQKLGYKGRYRAITETMPNADMIRAEIQDEAPDLDFDLLVMPPIANDG